MKDKPTEEIFSFTEISGVQGALLLQWSAKAIGFGETYISVEKDGIITINNEMMSKNFLKQMLCKMIDDAVLLDEVKLVEESE